MAITRKKITVVGAGFTGATTALMLAQKELGDVVWISRDSRTQQKVKRWICSKQVPFKDLTAT